MRITLVIGSAALIAAPTIAGTGPVEITQHARSIYADAEVISDFGCNDLISNSASAPDAAPWNESITTTAECGFEPEAMTTATASQVSEISAERLAASGTVGWDGWGSEYSDPESKEFFCSGAGGGGGFDYTVSFVVHETVAYHVVGTLDGGGTGDTYLELNSGQDTVFQYSFGEVFDETGLIEPGAYTLWSTAYEFESAFKCNGGSSGSANIDFVLEFSDACPADLDGSGGVAFPDLLALLSAWGPCKACAEDIDGNGTVDFADLLITLSSWGPCP